jgi:hypothetical protein
MPPVFIDNPEDSLVSRAFRKPAAEARGKIRSQNPRAEDRVHEHHGLEDYAAAAQAGPGSGFLIRAGNHRAPIVRPLIPLWLAAPSVDFYNSLPSASQPAGYILALSNKSRIS